MKTLLSFLLGGFVAICIAAGTTDIMTVKPAIPKSTVVFGGDSEDCITKTREYAAKGYVVKVGCNIGGRTEYNGGFVVMEKY